MNDNKDILIITEIETKIFSEINTRLPENESDMKVIANATYSTYRAYLSALEMLTIKHLIK